MTASRPATQAGPRERLLHHGPEVLTDVELLSLLLGSGTRRRGAAAVAASLVAAHGLEGLRWATPAELLREPGIGAAKAAALAAALEIARRLAGRRLERGDPIRSPADVARHFLPQLRDARTERFLVLLLDGRHRVLREVVASHGTLTASLVHPREVFRAAIREAAAALVLVHNHPSGDPAPSAEDLEITGRLARAGSLLGIPVLDHVVVAEQGWVSLREEGLLEEAEAGLGPEGRPASGPGRPGGQAAPRHGR